MFILTRILLESPSRALSASGKPPIFGVMNLASLMMALTFWSASARTFQFLSPISSSSSGVMLPLKQRHKNGKLENGLQISAVCQKHNLHGQVSGGPTKPTEFKENPELGGLASLISNLFTITLKTPSLWNSSVGVFCDILTNLMQFCEILTHSM